MVGEVSIGDTEFVKRLLQRGLALNKRTIAISERLDLPDFLEGEQVCPLTVSLGVKVGDVVALVVPDVRDLEVVTADVLEPAADGHAEIGEQVVVQAVGE